jgi:hypothetical protein
MEGQRVIVVPGSVPRCDRTGAWVVYSVLYVGRRGYVGEAAQQIMMERQEI